MVVESFQSWRSRCKDGVRTTVRKTLRVAFATFRRTGHVERSDAPACEVEKQLGYGLWLGRSQTSNAHLIGTRVGIVVARKIRRLPTSEREDSNLVGAMRGTPVAGRPADAAADNAPTVKRHAVERRAVIVVPAIFGAPLHAGSGESVSAPSNPLPNLPKPQSRGHNHHRLQWKAAIIQVARELTVLVLAMCLWRWHKRWMRQRSHTLRWRSVMKVSFQRDREGGPRRTAG